MMHDFLTENRNELTARCKANVRLRPHRDATNEQLKNGIPLFLDQLTRTLAAEQNDEFALSKRISGGSGGDALAPSEIGHGACVHGQALLALGYSVDQVVHDYGDLCQAITELASERNSRFAVEEFRTLNRCLDNAIADAVTGFSSARDNEAIDRLSSEANERLGALVHELRNSLQMANLSVRAMELGGLTLMGATGSVLKRSLVSMGNLIDSSLGDVRANRTAPIPRTIFSLADLVQDARTSAQLEADVRGCVLLVTVVDPVLRIEANRDLLLGSLANILSNAFKFTHPHTSVGLNAYALEDRIHIDVEDRCGGLPPNHEMQMFTPFAQLGEDKTGLGLGLSISRQNVEAMGGTLTVRNLSEVGCIFTIAFPLSTVDRRAEASSAR